MRVLLFLGSRRTSSPPQPPRLGERVSAFLATELRQRFDTQIVDPLAFPATEVFKPAFAYSQTAKPETLARMEELVRQADAYVMLSPEYNHCMSPALADLLNHFPSSAFSFKPSLIVTYSSGQWGGTRAAVNMRTFLSELGCLPVSAMVHFPNAHKVLSQDGEPVEGQNGQEWRRYAGRGIEQLYWWAVASATHRKAADPLKLSPAFSRTPADRNAPEA